MYVSTENLLCEWIQLVPREQVYRKSQPTQNHDKTTCGLEEAIRELEKLEHITQLFFFSVFVCITGP